MALIAKYTSWTEEFILWELPLARGNAYCHAMMRMENVNTQKPEDKTEYYRQIDEI